MGGWVVIRSKQNMVWFKCYKQVTRFRVDSQFIAKDHWDSHGDPTSLLLLLLFGTQNENLLCYHKA